MREANLVDALEVPCQVPNDAWYVELAPQGGWLAKHLDDPAAARDYVEKIRSSCVFLLSIINHVLEMARIESGKVTLTAQTVCIDDLASSLEAVFEPEVQKKRLKSDMKVAVRSRYILCDETKVREIFLNVISNSIKYTPEGGTVRVAIGEQPQQKAGFADYEILVADTGIGISPEFLPHIFEEFARENTSTKSRQNGTGLGLPIVKSLVELMGGTIQVESQPGQGTRTRICLSFPIVPEEAREEDQRQETERHQAQLRGRRILLAEDNALNAEITQTILEEKGLKLETAENGRICLDMLQSAPEDRYDLILMDIQMPVMDGLEAVRRIRALPGKRGKIPILAMTANAFEEDRRAALDAGMNGHIAKPIQVDTLLDAMAEAIAARENQ